MYKRLSRFEALKVFVYIQQLRVRNKTICLRRMEMAGCLLSLAVLALGLVYALRRVIRLDNS